MISKIRKLFKRKEEESEIEFMELGEWTSSLTLNKVQLHILEYNKRLKFLESALKTLEATDIGKQKVEEKLKVMVKGNKPAYITAAKTFAKKVVLPDKLTSRNLDIFCENFESSLKEFSKRTVRNYSVMNTIIGKELDEVAKGLKGLEDASKMIKGCIKKLKEIEQVHAIIGEVYTFLNEKNKKLKSLEDQRVTLMQKERLLNEDINALRNSDIFKEVAQLKAEKQDISTKMDRTKNDFNTKMAVLQRPLRKLSKLDVLKRTEGYATSPFGTLVGDDEMEINAIITSLKDSIERGKIDVKSSAAVSAVVSELSPELIKKARAGYMKLKRRLKEVDDSLAKNKFEEKEKKLVADLQELEGKLAGVNTIIDNMRQRKLSEDITLIERELKDISGHKVKIKNAPVD